MPRSAEKKKKRFTLFQLPSPLPPFSSPPFPILLLPPSPPFPLHQTENYKALLDELVEKEALHYKTEFRDFCLLAKHDDRFIACSSEERQAMFSEKVFVVFVFVFVYILLLFLLLLLFCSFCSLYFLKKISNLAHPLSYDRSKI